MFRKILNVQTLSCIGCASALKYNGNALCDENKNGPIVSQDNSIFIGKLPKNWMSNIDGITKFY